MQKKFISDHRMSGKNDQAALRIDLRSVRVRCISDSHDSRPIVANDLLGRGQADRMFDDQILDERRKCLRRALSHIGGRFLGQAPQGVDQVLGDLAELWRFLGHGKELCNHPRLGRFALAVSLPVEAHGPSWPGFAEIQHCACFARGICALGSAWPRNPGHEGPWPSIGFSALVANAASADPRLPSDRSRGNVAFISNQQRRVH